jgi:SAM-dependent methyltransferase
MDLNKLLRSRLKANRDVTSRLWGQTARDKAENDLWKLRSWDSHPVTYAYINRRITGDPAKNWLDLVKERFAPAGVRHGLSLGCGSGSLERHSVRIGLCREMDGCDVAPDALAVARELAAKEGLEKSLHYIQLDLNSGTLQPSKYDICFSGAAIHHVLRLEHAFDQIRQALRPGGLLVLFEYVGPSSFQWDDKTERLMNRLLAILPESYRMSLREPGRVKRLIERASIDQVAAVDPSESVRSADILGVLEQSFQVVYRVDVGGTLLQFLLADIVGNFRPDDPKDLALLELFTLFEETLIAEGVIRSDFVMLVAKPAP